MTAPFDLPDFIDLYTSGHVLLYEAVPARVVPMFKPQYFFSSNAGSPMTRYGPTHWVDLADYPFLNDGFLVDEAFKIHTNGPLLLIHFAAPEAQDLWLQVDYAESRYTNTPNQHQRAYCTRVSRDPP